MTVSESTLSALDYAMLSEALRPGVRYALERDLPLNEVFSVLRHNVIDEAVGQMGRDLEEVSENVFEFKGGRRIVALIDEMVALFSRWREGDDPEERRPQVLLELLAYRSRGLGHMHRSLKAQDPELWWPDLDAAARTKALEDLLEGLVDEGMIEKTVSGSTTWYRSMGFSLRAHVGQWVRESGVAVETDSPPEVSQGKETFSLASRQVLKGAPLSGVRSFRVRLPKGQATLELDDVAHLLSRRLELLDKETRLDASNHTPTIDVDLAMAWVPCPGASVKDVDMKAQAFGRVRSFAQKTWLDPEERRQFLELLRSLHDQNPQEFEERLGPYLRTSNHMDLLGSVDGISAWSDKLVELDIEVHQALEDQGTKAIGTLMLCHDMAMELTRVELFESAKNLNERIRNVVAPEDGVPSSHYVRATSQLARCCIELDESEQAIDLLEDVFALEPTEDVVSHLEAKYVLGLAYIECSRYRDAKNTYEDMIAQTVVRFGSRHRLLGLGRAGLGIVHYFLSDYQTSRLCLEDGISILDGTVGQDSQYLLEAKANLGVVLMALEEINEALEITQEVLDIRIRALGPSHLETLRSENNLGMIYLRMEKWNRAHDVFQSVADKKSKKYGYEHRSTIVTLHNIVSVLAKMERLEEAFELSKLVVSASKQVYGSMHTRTLNALNIQGDLLRIMGQYDQAKEVLEGLIEQKIENFGAQTFEVATTRVSLAVVMLDLGDKAAARTLLEQARPVVEREFARDDGTEHSKIALIRRLLLQAS